jgi:hypothetical protein
MSKYNIFQMSRYRKNEEIDKSNTWNPQNNEYVYLVMMLRFVVRLTALI